MDNTTTCQRCSRPVADGAYCCTACTRQVQANLDYIAEMHTELETTLARLNRHGDGSGGRRATDEMPLPVNLHASDVGHRLRNTLTTWARVLVEESGAAEPRGGLSAVARFLSSRLDWVSRCEWAPEAYDEISRRAVDLDRAIDSPAEMIGLGKCDTCSEWLRAHKEATWTTCRPCGTSYNVHRRREQLLRRAEVLIRPAPFIARVLSDLMPQKELKADTIHKWVERKKLRRRGWDDDGFPTFRLGDVKALHQASIQRDILKAAKAEKAEVQAA